MLTFGEIFPLDFQSPLPTAAPEGAPATDPRGAVPCGSASSSSWVLLFMGRAPTDVLCSLLVSLVSLPSLAAAQDAGPHF